MRSRWFHRPILHSPVLGLEKRATWLELFYDLVFVASFIQLGNSLAHHVTLGGALGFAGVFAPIWTAWTGFTFFQNRYTLDDFTHRLLVFVQMFAIGGMAVAAPGVAGGKTVAFAISSGVAQLVIAAMYFRAWRQEPEAKQFGGYWSTVFVASAATWLVAAAVPAPWCYGLWAVATLIVLVSPMTARTRSLAERYPLDWEHLSERYALLTLIVLGESFVKVLSTLVEEGAGIDLLVEAEVLLLLTCGVWWVYFDDVAGAHLKHGRGKMVVWLYSHLFLQVAVTAFGVAVKKAVHFRWDEPAGDAYRWLLAGSLALVYFSVAALDSVTERKQAELSDRARVNARWLSGVILLVLAPAGRTMSGGLFLVLVAAVNVAQVVFDMMMAPFEQSAASEKGARTTADMARDRAAGHVVPGRPRRTLAEAVRKGTPASLRRDLYFYFIEGSWTRVFVAFGFFFVIANVFFAGLYVLEPGSIANARTDSFADAFYFSVQTMATIGYGGLNPASDYANAIVTVESALSMVGVAIVTGLVFAKVSRPKASILFSKVATINEMDGKKTLSFRLGNARGNEIADATMTVTVLKDELTKEGQHMRRMHDLRLTRDRSPMFVLTWTAMHPIDASSCLADVDWSQPEKHVMSMVVTVIGHDSTYGQTVYARHIYYPEDFRPGAKFVDVLSQLEDGRLMIDYTRFHDVEPERAPEPPAASSAPAPTEEHAEEKEPAEVE